ncbi:trans-sulfuration enzyme family protein [Treponema sp.]|uniref:trans-sulfuration enzyme family protein n=1 Tax=Treponema sp. TaxID=166 RepID=UPI00298DF86F|nr:aminotransferase class V-fold PLP-dependent enzyme [Treponema sp.]MCQ2240080.1 aminotransferase class V-fold PLP-dependent enzyme [Treponema sp.]
MSYCFETVCVKGDPDYESKDSTGCVSVPIYQSACYGRGKLGQSTGFDYTRAENPTREYLEKTVAALDNAKYGFAFANGMAAITTYFLTLPKGSHVIVSEDSYGGTIRLFDNLLYKSGITVTYVDSSNLEQVEAAFTENTKILYIETPGNPLMTISDIRGAALIAHHYNAILVVDNTFLTPYLQRPLDLGADIVIQSGTKFLAGHNDTLAGFITTNNDEVAQQVKYISKTVGTALSPFDSWLVVRGIKTLPIRLDRQGENARALVEFLKNQKHVEKVLYPGVGSMISFYVDDEERAVKVLEKIRVIHFAESLGGVDSLMTYPFTQTHSDIPEEKRIAKGITRKLLRLSVGIEGIADLKNDLEQALN